MATTEERLTALERAVVKLAANKIDVVDVTAINNLNLQRYADLHTAYVSLVNDLTALQMWVVNHQTGNNI